LGSYEFEKQQKFVKAVSPGAVVYDVGANVGFYTLLASKLVGSEGHVIAFEPVPRNLRYLRDHLTLNQCTNVTVIEVAVLEKESMVFIDDSLGSSMNRVSDSGRLEVSSVSLDELFLSGRIPKADVIKMDIEGSEYRALCGARRLLAECHPIIFLSTHSPDVHRRCCDLLQSLGYRLGTIGSRWILDTDELICVG
jgi:FkbM family methyltransferase